MKFLIIGFTLLVIVLVVYYFWWVLLGILVVSAFGLFLAETT